MENECVLKAFWCDSCNVQMQLFAVIRITPFYCSWIWPVRGLIKTWHSFSCYSVAQVLPMRRDCGLRKG